MDTVGDGDKRDVRRPMNAFLIFCKRHRSIVREKNPDLDNRSVTRILGDLWANLKDEEKLVYTDLAKQYKDAFMKANPDYKWHNPEKAVTCQKSGVTLSKPTKGLKSEMNLLPEGSIIPGKLADPCNMGGLSLLLMAGEQQCRIEQNDMSSLTGTHTPVTGTHTPVTGTRSSTPGTYSSLAGTHTPVTGTNTTLTGTHSNVTGFNSTVVGAHFTTSGTHSMLTGTHSTLAGTQNIVTGTHFSTPGTHSTLVGTHSTLAGTHSNLAGTHNVLTGTHSTMAGTHRWMDTSHLTHKMKPGDVTTHQSGHSINVQHSAVVNTADMKQLVSGATNVIKSRIEADGIKSSVTTDGRMSSVKVSGIKSNVTADGIKSITSIGHDERLSRTNTDRFFVAEKHLDNKDTENRVNRQTIPLTKLKDTAQTKPLLYQAVAAPKLPARSLLADAFRDSPIRDETSGVCKGNVAITGHLDIPILKDNVASTKIANFENQGHVLENVSRNDTETMETKLLCKVDEKENITQKVVSDVKLDDDTIKDDESPMVTCGKLVVNHIIDRLYSSDLASAARKAVSASKDEVDGLKDVKDNKNTDVKIEQDSVVKVEHDSAVRCGNKPVQLNQNVVDNKHEVKMVQLDYREMTGIKSLEFSSEGVNAKDKFDNGVNVEDNSGNVSNKTSGKWKGCSTVNRVETTANRWENSANQVETSSNRAETSTNRVETSANRVETSANRVETTANRVESSANRVETLANRVESSANRGEDSTESEDIDDSHPVRKSRRRNRGQRYQELINEGIIQLSKERMAALNNPDKKEESPDEDVQPIHTYNSYVLPETAIRRIRKRTTSESAKDKIFHTDDVKRYKTGDFDLEAEIAILPACSVENMGRKRGFARQRHSSECIHTHRKLSESDTISIQQPVFNVEKIVTLPPHIKVLPDTSQEPVVGSRKRKARKHSITHMVPAPATLIKNGKVKSEVSGLGPCLIKPSDTSISDQSETIEHVSEVAMETDKLEHSSGTKTCSLATECDTVTDGRTESNICDKTVDIADSDSTQTGCDQCLLTDSHSSPNIETQSRNNSSAGTQSENSSGTERQSGVGIRSENSSCTQTQAGIGIRLENSCGAESESVDTVCQVELLPTTEIDKNDSSDTKIGDKNEVLRLRTDDVNMGQTDDKNDAYKTMRKKETDVNSNNTINYE